MENWTEQPVQVKEKKVLKRSLKLGMGREGRGWRLLKSWRWHGRKAKTNNWSFCSIWYLKWMTDFQKKERETAVCLERWRWVSPQRYVWDYIEVARKDLPAKREMQTGRKRKGGRCHRELKKYNQCMLTADWMMLFRSRQRKYKMSRRHKGVPTANEKYVMRGFAQYCKYWKTNYGGKIYWIMSIIFLIEMYISVLTENIFRNATFSANKKIREEKTSSSYTKSKSFCKIFVLTQED